MSIVCQYFEIYPEDTNFAICTFWEIRLSLLKIICIDVLLFPELSHTGLNINDFIDTTINDWSIQTK